MSEAPLSGLSVIDLTHYIGGPLCTKLLAGMGAEVIKVEQPGHGDPARRMGPFPDDLPDHEKSGTFLYLNTGKKSITLNLKSATGIKILKDLVKEADVLVENFEPRVMQSLGLSYSILERINPRLVITSISNFGQTGPYRDYKAEEMAILALGGMMYLIGDPEREPLRWGFEAAQYMGGLSAFTGTMAALHYVEQTGAGQQVDISLLEGIVAGGLFKIRCKANIYSPITTTLRVAECLPPPVIASVGEAISGRGVTFARRSPRFARDDITQ